MKKIVLFICSFLYFQPVFAETQLTTAYDSKKNTISINASNVSFLDLMRRIGLQTGIEFYADLSINKMISYQVVNAPLEKTITQLTKGLNAAISYTEKNQKKGTTFIISSIQILPNGQTNPKNAVALSTTDSAALAYAQFSDPAPLYDETNITNDNYDHMQTRWLARVSKLPLKEREHIENIIKQRQEKKEQSIAKHQITMEIVKQSREKQRQQIEDKETALMEKDPERYKLRELRRQEIRQSIENETKK